jgi:dihydrofolate reductase
MSITLIAALAKNRCIGKGGALPWHLLEDLKHFKELTTGHVVVMGRKTWESIPKKFQPLPERTNVVLTRQHDYVLPQTVERYGTLHDALTAHAQERVFIMGGAEIYAQALPLADKLELTLIDRAVDGDVFFPPIEDAMWHESARTDHPGFSFVTYERAS